MIVMDYKPFPPFGVGNIDGHMLFGMMGKNCRTTIVGGKVVYKDRESVGIGEDAITAGDECYNCEWSTELTVPQAYAEYVKAWWACKLLARELGLGSPDGFVFNMSVGYDLAGIQSGKINKYIEGMKDASGSEVWQECLDWSLSNLGRFRNVDESYVKTVSPRVSASITESTLHGCPPDEIERIATYLITEKGLNTYIKCNPTDRKSVV